MVVDKRAVRRKALGALTLETLVACAILGAVTVSQAGEDVFAFYATTLRSSLFTGFLTASSFLLALQTFIIVRMKEGVYDTSGYQKRYRDATKRNSLEGIYRPLEALANLLFAAIVASLGTSLSQVTVGLVAAPFSAAFCLASTGATLGLLFFTLFEIRANMLEWFKCLEDDKRAVSEEPPANVEQTLQLLAQAKENSHAGRPDG